MISLIGRAARILAVAIVLLSLLGGALYSLGIITYTWERFTTPTLVPAPVYDSVWSK